MDSGFMIERACDWLAREPIKLGKLVDILGIERFPRNLIIGDLPGPEACCCRSFVTESILKRLTVKNTGIVQKMRDKM